MQIKKPAPGANLDTGYAAFDSLNFNTINQFRDAIQAAGLTPPDTMEADGKLHRFASNGKRKDDAGWYLLHGDGIPAGSFGDWRTDFRQTWRADIGRTLTPVEEAAHRAKVEAMRREREAEETRRKTEAQATAGMIWNTAKPAPEDHPYLVRKHIKANGAKLHNGALVIPMRSDGKIHSLQFIGPEGGKRFLTGGRVSGCYFSIGNPKGAAALCIAEGFATGATIHEATGYPVAVAFNAGNLLAVAKAMCDKFPGLPLILCADDDYRTDGNPGMSKATEAARAVGGLLAIPDFGSDRPDGATDFNDMAVLCGADAVKQAITSAVASVTDEDQPNMDDAPGETPARDSTLSESGVSEVAGVQANNHGLSAETPDEPDEVAGVADTAASPIPDAEKRPCFCVFDDWLEHGGAKYRPGVWYFGLKDSKGDAPPTLTQTWICSPLHVEAVTFDGQDNNFGRLLRFKN